MSSLGRSHCAVSQLVLQPEASVERSMEQVVYADTCLLPLLCGPPGPGAAVLVLAAPHPSSPLIAAPPSAHGSTPRRARPSGCWPGATQPDPALAARQRGLLVRHVAQCRGCGPPAGAGLHPRGESAQAPTGCIGLVAFGAAAVL